MSRLSNRVIIASLQLVRIVDMVIEHSHGLASAIGCVEDA